MRRVLIHLNIIPSRYRSPPFFRDIRLWCSYIFGKVTRSKCPQVRHQRILLLRLSAFFLPPARPVFRPRPLLFRLQTLPRLRRSRFPSVDSPPRSGTASAAWMVWLQTQKHLPLESMTSLGSGNYVRSLTLFRPLRRLGTRSTSRRRLSTLSKARD